MAERTLKINADLTDLKVGLKDLVASIDRLNKKLDEVGQRTQQNFAKSTQGAKTYKKSLDELQAELKQLETGLTKARAKDPFTRGRQREITNYKKRIAEVNTQIDRMKTKTDAAANAQSRFNKQVSLGRQLMLRLRSVMLTVFGAYAIIQGIRNTINTVKDFELGMARVAAITGATADEVDRLAASAKALSTSGIFNPAEITELQVKLAKLGFTIQEIADATEGIINLATATGEDLATAAETVASVIRGLGLDASETGRIVDVLGKSFTSSALDINKFRESAKFVVPLAREMGWTIEELSAVLGKLSDNIISGSLAGTGLRTLFIELSDPTSKLAEIMGTGINTFDEFIDAMIRMQEEGVTTAEVLEAVPKRAVTLFVSLMNMGEDVRVFAEELRNANGAIDEMANVQMDTLAYQMERFNNAWQSFILSIQENGGFLTDLFEGYANVFENLARMIDPLTFALVDASRNVENFMEIIGGRNSQGKLSAIEEEINRIRYAMIGLDEATSDGAAEMKRYREQIRLLNDETLKIRVGERLGLERLGLDKIINAKEEGEATAEDVMNAFYETMAKIASAREAGQFGDPLEFFVLEEVEKQLLNELTELLAKYDEEEKKALAESLKNRDEYIKNMRALYAQLRANELANNENRIQSELERELEILRINQKYTKLNLELDIMSGKLTEAQVRAKQDALLILEETYQRERLELIESYRQKEFQEEIDAFERQAKLAKEQGATERQIMTERIELYVRLLKAKIALARVGGITEEEAKSIMEMGEAIQFMNAQLLNMGFDDDGEGKIEDKTTAIANAYKKLGREIIQTLETVVDAQVENTSRLVDDLDTRIAETQRALEIETELYIEGYANNVSLKKKELSDLKEARDQAIVDREKAVRRQQQLEAIAQAIDLASAVASTIKIYSKIPGVGLAIAAVVAGGFLALFSAMQAKSKNIAQYGEGGEIDGDSHARGGVLIEAEGGEFIMRKSAYAKYPELVRAINEDNLPEFNATVMNSVGGGGDVIIDNEIWHKMYNLWDKNLNKGKVEVIGGKKIVTRGIRKRTINV